MNANLLLTVVICLLILFSVLFFVALVMLIKLKRKYKPVVDAELKSKKIMDETLTQLNSIKNEIEILKESYNEKKSIYDGLNTEIKKIQDTLENSEICLNDYEFSFRDSEENKVKIEENLGKQKELVRDKQAIACETQWTVGGSVKSGRKMINESLKTTLRAFNSECDMIISRVSWRNYQASIEKIKKSFLFYNNYNETLNIKIRTYP